MSSPPEPWPAPQPAPAAGLPHPPPPPPRRPPSLIGTALRLFFGLVFSLSLVMNCLVLVFLVVVIAGVTTGLRAGLGDETLRERYHSGQRDAADMIAIVEIDGPIMEGLLSYPRKQINTAATDPQVKAVVVRINSPGGTITASDELYKRLRELRDGDPARHTTGKPLVVSMGSLAASGGYYIAMPASHVVAERSTITGSIGVYAALPNIAELAKDYGVRMNVIKAGEVKDSGNMFHPLTTQERQVWQDMVDHAYDQFMAVVREGRGQKLKYDLRDEIKDETKEIPERDADGNVVKDKQLTYVRRLADGGIFTADKALKYGLIDQIGYLDDAIAEARKQARLGDHYRAVTYDRPLPFLSSLLGVDARSSEAEFSLKKLAAATGAHLWYLAPQSELSALLAAGN